MSNTETWDFIFKNSNLIYFFIHYYKVDANDWEDCWNEAALHIKWHVERYGTKCKSKTFKQAVYKFVKKQRTLSQREVLTEEGVAV